MKINKRKPMHWLLLIAFFAQGVAGLILRCLRKQGSKHVVVLYGHKLNGNLLALYRFLRENDRFALQPVFLTLDIPYHRLLQATGTDSRIAASFESAELLAEAAAVITSHGLHSLQPLRSAYRLLGLRFFDVWHGIPYKGFDGDDFKVQHRYDETWVASDLNRELWARRFGFDPTRVVATGYPRTDRLVNRLEDPAELRSRLGLPSEDKVILFAPTWKQDSRGRSIYPFGCEEHEFLDSLSRLAQRHQATVVLRSHLNSSSAPTGNLANVVALPASDYPDTEGILLASDMLICDWSSIAFDFLLLDRPTFFLDVEPPFRKGFSLGPEYRFGAVTADLPALLRRLGEALEQPDRYWIEFGNEHQAIKRKVYGEYADGHASERCSERLVHHLRPCPPTSESSR